MAEWRDPFQGVGEQESLFGEEAGPKVPGKGAMVERFLMPPFTVMNANGGEWGKRKRKWLEHGFKGEAGRPDDLCFDGWNRHQEAYGWIGEMSQTSIFDPVLTELSYRWFCPPGGLVLDPYSGGVTRGLIAAALGLDYVGIDIREEQITENLQQWKAIGGEDWGTPVWVLGDGTKPIEAAPGAYDFVLTCPPYWNLEKYSDDPDDLSNLSWDEFGRRYCSGIAESATLLKDDRFAVYVVGDVRDKDLNGCYRSLMALTMQAFEAAGMYLYNQGILVVATGSLPIRASHTFVGSRKLGTQHQFVLVFVKGDPKAAHAACGPVAAFDYSALDPDLVKKKRTFKE